MRFYACAFTLFVMILLTGFFPFLLPVTAVVGYLVVRKVQRRVSGMRALRRELAERTRTARYAAYMRSNW